LARATATRVEKRAVRPKVEGEVIDGVRGKAPLRKPVEDKTTPEQPMGLRARETLRTRANIIRQATREFALRGFDGGRVDRIAARCQCSKFTLYYHFKSKDGLIVAVLENMYFQLRNRQKNERSDWTSPT
jgi:endonuclease YncB( thermonuclease family)